LKIKRAARDESFKKPRQRRDDFSPVFQGREAQGKQGRVVASATIEKVSGVTDVTPIIMLASPGLDGL
jgi:hypothetical protein